METADPCGRRRMRKYLEEILWAIASGGLLLASVTSSKDLLLMIGIVLGSSLISVVTSLLSGLVQGVFSSEPT